MKKATWARVLMTTLLALFVGLASVTVHAEPAYAAERASQYVSEGQAYDRIVALKSEYPDGLHWTNEDNFYYSDVLGGGYGCHAFALILSDAAFGSNNGMWYYEPDYIRVGDVVRMYGSHTVVVLEVRSDGYIVAEGNFNSSVKWGRFISNRSMAEGFTYGITRYTYWNNYHYRGYRDVKGDAWYVKGGAFDFVIDNYIMQGYGYVTDDGYQSFGPYDNVTRGQAVAVLYKLEKHLVGWIEDSGVAQFDDVDDDAYYAQAIKWARVTGVASGTGNNKFEPDNDVTREQLVTLLRNYARYKGLDMGFTYTKAQSLWDWSEVSSYARDSFAWAVDQGIISGVDVDGVRYARPHSTSQRAMMAAMTASLCKKFTGHYWYQNGGLY